MKPRVSWGPDLQELQSLRRNEQTDAYSVIIVAGLAGVSALSITSDMLLRILDKLWEGVVVVDDAKRIVYWNKAAENITGLTKDDVFEKPCDGKLFEHADIEGGLLCGTQTCPVQRALLGLSTDAEVLVKHKLGFRVPISYHAFPLEEISGRVTRVAQIFLDNRPVKDALVGMEQAQRMALQDGLTGLGNRGYAEIHLQRSLLELDRYGFNFAVFFIDVDRFKSVNDDFGHEVGDRVLQMVAGALLGSLRSSDVIARWGGEEFVCLVLHIMPDQVPAIADKVRTAVEQRSIGTDQGICRVTISVGATLARSEDTSDTLINRADSLMYRSKQKGRNRVTTDADLDADSEKS